MVGTHLYQLSQHRLLYAVGVGMLFEARAADVSVGDADEVKRMLSDPGRRSGGGSAQMASFGRVSRTAALQPSHRLNAMFMDEVLTALPMAERDLRWTEGVRASAEEWFDEVEAFEDACRRPGAASPVVGARMCLAAHRYQWLLPSTNRLLRDVATRALYWYGWRQPRALFDLALAAFAIDDPYVRERLLAAAYGTSMALHANPDHGAELRAALPGFASELYAALFAPGAPHATTHALIRDYARNTIELARLHHPNLLGPEQVARITPPFADGGLREWGASDDRNEGEYRDGDRPLGFDFEHYTLGGLVPGHRDDEATHPEYRRLVRHVWWRIYQLGYTLDRFRAVDQAIARAHGGRPAEDNADRVDRYGKKYAWIAYFEQYGLRDDLGMFAALGQQKPRPSDADVDPSFPIWPETTRLITTDLFGDRTLPLARWLAHGPGPDLGPWLVVDAIDGERGPWVLLDGYVGQEDVAANRTCFAFLRGLLVRRDDVARFATQLAAQHLGGRWLPEGPTDRYLFAGEIPWSPLFPVNGWVDVHVTARRPDEPLDCHEPGPTRVLLPVRQHGWETYHSGANDPAGAYVPARELAEPLGLWLRLPSWDFHDATGGRVTRLLVAGTGVNDREKLLYMRQDALDRVLAGQGLGLVWGVWGERNVVTREDPMARRGGGEVASAAHQRVYTYAAGAATPVSDPLAEVGRSGGPGRRTEVGDVGVGGSRGSDHAGGAVHAPDGA